MLRLRTGAERGGGVKSALSLFAGAGGLDLGARMAGLNVVASVELDPLACKSLGLNGFYPVQADATALDYSQWRGVEVLFGGPPCQGHSIANTARSVADPRNLLAWEMVRAARETSADTVLIENVITLDRKLLMGLTGALAELGYWVSVRRLNAADYGVPQTRQRLFIMATRSLAHWPEPTHLNNWQSIDSALADLWPTLERRRIPAWMDTRVYRPGARLRDEQDPRRGTGGRMGHEPAQTVVRKAHNWTWIKDGESGRLGVKGAARLQTFPDDHIFVGGVQAQSLQVANAVPPLLAYHLLSGVAS